MKNASCREEALRSSLWYSGWMPYSVLLPAQMAELKMGALLGVAQGSVVRSIRSRIAEGGGSIQSWQGTPVAESRSSSDPGSRWQKEYP